MYIWGKGRAVGWVGPGQTFCWQSRVGSGQRFAGSGRVQEKWPVDISDLYVAQCIFVCLYVCLYVCLSVSLVHNHNFIHAAFISLFHCSLTSQDNSFTTILLS